MARIIDDFRAQNPGAYDDLSDFEIARGLHAKYQNDFGAEVPLNEFAGQLGMELETQALPSPLGGPSMRDRVQRHLGQLRPDAVPRSVSDYAAAPGDQRFAETATAGAVDRGLPQLRGILPRGQSAFDTPAARDVRDPAWRERQVVGELDRMGADRKPPGAYPSAEPNAIQRLFGERGAVTPETEAEAVIEATARREGMSGQEFKERYGARTGVLERALKDVGSGAVATGAGMMGFASMLTEGEGLRAGTDAANRQARELLPADPNFLDQVAAGFGSTATFFVPGAGIAKGAQAVYQVAPRMGLWLGSGAAAGMEAATEAGAVYDQLRGDGLSHEQALERAEGVFWANAPLVAVTNRLGIFGDRGGQLQRRSLAAVNEGVAQEGPQQAISNWATGEPLSEGVLESMAIGSIVGGTLGGSIKTREERAADELEQGVEAARLPDPGASARAALSSDNAQMERVPEAEAIPAEPTRLRGERQDSSLDAIVPERRVADMTPDEMRQALLVSDLTGLPNRRAFLEAEKQPARVSMDVDSLKWVNDAFGHDTGNQLLSAVGQALREEGVEAYHVSGDEFLMQAASVQEADAAMARVMERLSRAKLRAEGPDGQVYEFSPGVSYGAAATLPEAEARLGEHKAAREQTGERAGRGERPPGVVEIPAQGQQNRERGTATERITPLAQPPAETPAPAGVSRSEPWEMTRAEYAQARERAYVEKRGEAVPGVAATNVSMAADRQHKRLVREAIEQGRDVPQRVRDEYPDLSRRTGTSDSRTSSMQPGAAYVPILRERISETETDRAPTVRARTAKPAPVEPSDEPIRREHIIKAMEKAFGVKIYQGRVKGKNRLGFFRHGVGEIRTKARNDLEVTAHEFAHWLDDRYPAFSKDYRQAPYRKEMQGISYDVSKLHEGFAEFMRLFMTQEHEAVLRTPLYYDKFIETIERLGIADPIYRVQEQMHTWYAQGALNRMKSKIGDPGPTVGQYIGQITDRLGDRLIQESVDGLHAVKIVERELRGTIADADLSPYKNMRLAMGARGVTRAVFEHGTIGWTQEGDVTFTGKGLRQVFEPVGDVIEDTLTYFAARRAAELKKQGRENLFDKDEIAAGLALGKQTPRIVKAFEDWRAFSARMMDFYEGSGLLSAESRKAMEEMNQDYVPFHRVMEAATGEKLTRANPFKRLRGGTANVADILDNIAASTAILIDAALKNRAKQQLYKLIDHSTDSARFAVRIPTDTKPTSVDIAQVQDKFVQGVMGITLAQYKQAAKMGQGNPAVDQMLERIESNLGEFATFFTFGHEPIGGNIDSVLMDGKRVYYEIADPMLLKSIEAWGPRPLGLAMRIAGGFKTVLTRSITAMPDFQIPNLLRDSFNGYALSKGGMRPFTDSVAGMINRLRADDTYWEFMANGGGFASTVHGETQEMRRNLERFYASKGVDYKRVLDTPSKLLASWDEISSAFEYGTRLAEYKRLRAQGASRREAAFEGREISTDFAMRGTSDFVRVFTTTVPFMNARMQGLYRLAREMHEANGKMGALGERAGQFAMKGLIGITLPTLALYAINADDERYQALPDYIRDLHWVIFIPGSDDPLLIPKPFEIGQIFATIPERMAELIKSGDGERFGDSMLWIVGDAFSLNPVPQIIKPWYEQWGNENFTGAPIIPEDLRDVTAAEQFRPWTAESMVQLGRETGLSPMRVEHLIRGYFGTLGMYALSAADNLLLGTGERGEAPDARLDEMPVIRRFIRQAPYRGTQYESDFYDLAEQVREVTATFNKIATENRAEDLEKYLNEADRQILFSVADTAQDIRTAASKLNREMRMVRISKDLSGAQKRADLDRLQTEKNKLFHQAAQELNPRQLKSIEKELRGP